MPSKHLQHAFPIAASPTAVFEHLSDPSNYVGLSPLVVEVRDVRAEDGVTHYTAVERFRFLGFVKYDNPIKVTLVGDAPDAGVQKVGGLVVSPGAVAMTYSYEISPDGAGSAIVDTLHLHAPFGLVRFAASRARSVQLSRARILAERLEGRSEQS
jgi:hypothetical protein